MSNELRLRRLTEHQVASDGDHLTLSYPFPKSPTGKVQRFCPSAGCRPRTFQIGNVPPNQTLAGEGPQLCRRVPGTPACTCPYCGTDAPDDDFTAPADLEAAKEFVAWAFREDVGDWLVDLASDFNREVGRDSFLKMNMSVKRQRRAKPYPFREDLLRMLSCSFCGRDYGVYAMALFCPDCGGRNVHVHFRRELELIERQVALAREAEGRQEHELAYRLLGNAHEDVLTAFETYLKLIYRFIVGRRFSGAEADEHLKAGGGNAFQNLERCEGAYARLGLQPLSVLSTEELESMRLQIEKRHVIGHNLGLVDAKFLQVSQDQGEGQNAQVLADDIVAFGQGAFKVVVSGLEEICPEFLPPST